jgi:hypothetical protein
LFRFILPTYNFFHSFFVVGGFWLSLTALNRAEEGQSQTIPIPFHSIHPEGNK